MKRLSHAIAAAAAAAFLAAAPGTAGAAAHRIVIRPNSLQPYRSTQSDIHSGAYVGSATAAAFWRELRLPVGARITGLSHQRIALDGSLTAVSVQRVRADANPTVRTIFSAVGSDTTPPDRAWTTVAGTATGEPRRVRGGWTYFVFVQTSSGNAAVGTITVRYRTP